MKYVYISCKLKMSGRLSPSGRNLDELTRQINRIGFYHNISDDITNVVVLYYVAQNKSQVDVGNVLVMCEKHKSFFIEAIAAEKKAREYYSRPDEYNAMLLVNANIAKLSEIKTAVGLCYCKLPEKRQRAITLLQESNTPFAQYYLGIYYTSDQIKYNEGFRQFSGDIRIQEAKYQKYVEAIVAHTMYKHDEVRLLEYAIECAQKTLEDSVKKLDDIQNQKDTLRTDAMQKITDTITYVIGSR